MKIEQPEKERKIKAYYESESAKALQEMDALNIKFSTIGRAKDNFQTSQIGQISFQ